MPFSGPEGQGPYDSIEDCVADIEDNEDIDDPAALCAYWKELDENQANAMTEPPTDEPEYRHFHQPDPSLVSVREVDDESDDGIMTVRMPIASTGEVRNEGDEPLTREELDGMARQINERDVGVFLAHGDSFEITDARYGQTERLGTWREGAVSGSDEDGSDLLIASAEMADPETLPAATGRYREALAIIKEQAKRDIPMSASIGWREDDDAPGGNDLMEASIVGIPADPRTVTQGGPAVAVARAAVDAGADPEALVAAVRAAVTGDRDPADHDDMSEPDDPEPEAENEAEGTDNEETTERQDAPEWAERMLEKLDDMSSTLGDVAEAVRQDDDDEDEEDDDENATDDDDEEEDEDEQSADVTEEQREALATLRDGGFDVDDLDLNVDHDDDDENREADTADADPGDTYNKYGLKPT